MDVWDLEHIRMSTNTDPYRSAPDHGPDGRALGIVGEVIAVLGNRPTTGALVGADLADRITCGVTG